MLVGCRKQDSQEVIKELYEFWKQMNMDVWIADPSVTGEVINLLGEEICTKNGVEKMFYLYYLTQENMYCEEGGVLYRRLAEIPANYGGELVELKHLEEKEEYIHAKMDFPDNELGNSYTIDIEAVRENGKWLVDNLEQEEYTNEKHHNWIRV